MENTKSQEEKSQEFMQTLKRLAEAREVLSGKKNVFDVGISYKTTDGKTTNQLSLVVYVFEKQSPEQLSEDDMIPTEIKGIPTDVRVVPVYDEQVTYTDKVRPCKGGTQLGFSNWMGTLGCFATRRTDGSWVMLSNHHVMFADTGKEGDPVYQPTHGSGNPIGHVIHGKRAKIGNINDRALVDAAIASVDPGDMADEVLVKNQVWTIGELTNTTPRQYSETDGPVNGVAPNIFTEDEAGRKIWAPIEMDAHVRKVGRTTGKTYGIITGIGVPSGVRVKNSEPAQFRWYRDQIEIKFADPDKGFVLDPLKRFSNEGDSGSAILDDQNRLVGLLFSGGPEKVNGRDEYSSKANNIHHVLEAMDIWVPWPPKADFQLPSGSFTAPCELQFDAAPSAKGEANIDTYVWDTGDRDDQGRPITGRHRQFSHIYTHPGTYYVRLTVIDALGQTGTVAKKIVING
jgi:hypothetical protein